MEEISLKNVYEKTKGSLIKLDGTNITQELQASNHYVFEEVVSLVITLGIVHDETIEKFSFEFDSGEIAATLSLPSGMGYIGGSPTIKANAHYYFEIKKSYDGRYFCKYEEYIGGGGFIRPTEIVSWTSSTITMNKNVTNQDVVDHLLIVSQFGNSKAYEESGVIVLKMSHGWQSGSVTINGNIITIVNYEGPTINDIQWV